MLSPLHISLRGSFAVFERWARPFVKKIANFRAAGHNMLLIYYWYACQFQLAVFLLLKEDEIFILHFLIHLSLLLQSWYFTPFGSFKADIPNFLIQFLVRSSFTINFVRLHALFTLINAPPLLPNSTPDFWNLWFGICLGVQSTALILQISFLVRDTLRRDIAHCARYCGFLSGPLAFFA